MKKAALLSLLLLMITSSNLKAQVTYGVKGGVNFTKMKYSQGSNSILGVHLGGFANIPLNENFSVEPALLLSTKGAKDVFVVHNYFSDFEKHNLSYLEVPVNLMYSIQTNNESIKPFVFAGPYFAFAVGGKITDSDNKSSKMTFGSTEDQDYKPLDMGVNLGAGIKVGKLCVSLQYGLGMSNINTNTNVILKNRNFGLSFGYIFGYAVK